MPDGKPEPVIRELCQQIAAEKNPSKLEDLVKSLQDSVEIERDETRLRLRLIAQQYRERIRSSPRGTRMIDVISFLGLISHRGKRPPDNKPEENERKENERKEKERADKQERLDQERLDAKRTDAA